MHLRNYIKNTGISQGLFAKKIGVGQTQFSFFMKKKRPLNPYYWNSVVEATTGAVTIEDLLQEYENDHATKMRTINERRKASMDNSNIK